MLQYQDDGRGLRGFLDEGSPQTRRPQSMQGPRRRGGRGGQAASAPVLGDRHLLVPLEEPVPLPETPVSLQSGRAGELDALPQPLKVQSPKAGDGDAAMGPAGSTKRLSGTLSFGGTRSNGALVSAGSKWLAKAGSIRSQGSFFFAGKKAKSGLPSPPPSPVTRTVFAELSFKKPFTNIKILAGTSDWQPKLYHLDADSGNADMQVALQGHAQVVQCMCADWSSHRVLTGAGDGMLKLWNLLDGLCLLTVQASKAFIVRVRERQPAVFAVRNDWTDQVDGVASPVHCLQVNWPHGLVVCGCESGYIFLWDFFKALSLNSTTQKRRKRLSPLELFGAATERTFQAHKGGVLAISVAWAPERLLSASYDRTMKVWNMKSGECTAILSGHIGYIRCCVFDGSSQALSGGSDCTVKLWEISTLSSCTKVLRGHSSIVSALSVDWPSKRALSGAGDAIILQWDLSTGGCVRSFTGHRLGILSLAVDWQNDVAISGSWDETVKVWDLDKDRSKDKLLLQVPLGTSARCICMEGAEPPPPGGEHMFETEEADDEAIAF